ncbi:polysaccharide biosynthesis tyrosine autokinase [Leptolyngbya sp. NK1-12]|uniref:non-specific protein-tyrosine kinase n=1 Tax=Leptolyngbya sp. NK1-12 TaxID=2547451 RepID=A0AA97ASU1_9CYAN|nr:polysaccharide biosynthesis tyrosine autokinase [Leptolyngbya sp. NK1-12]WNZ27663.1 polysaccharide biosynthesis tyrosine autokinase [Leptolyngbya sp. NK1-12]
MKATQNLPILLSTPPISAPPENEGGLELGRVVAALRRQVWLIAGVTTVMIGAAVLKIVTATPIYRSGFEILTEPVTVETEVLSSLPQTLSSRQDQSLTTTTLDETKIRVLRSPDVLNPVVEELKRDYPEITYESLIRDLVIQVDAKNILQVSYGNPDKELVQTVLDLLSEAYLRYSLEDRRQDIRRGIDFVDSQLPALKSQVAQWQGQLQEFRQQYNLIDPESQASLLSDQMGSLRRDLIETQTQLRETRLTYQQLQTALSQPSLEQAGSSPLVDSPRYQKLLDQLLEIDSQLAQDSILYLERSPELNVLLQQRQSLLPLLQQEGFRVAQQVASQIQELQDREQSLSASIGSTNQQIKQLSAVMRQYTDIQRELEIATDNLTQFLAKREGLRIDAAQRQLPWRLLTAPNEPYPSAASTKRTLALGAILGLLLGTGAALAIDRLSSVLHTSKEVKDSAKLPILGIIPTNKSLNELDQWLSSNAVLGSLNGSGSIDSLQFHRLMADPFLEAFRLLCVNVRLLSPDRPIRSLTVSSPVPANGKTTVAFYLAQVAAAMGQRVLLVDGDLRRPSLHHRLNLSNSRGLTDLIAHSLEYEQAIQQTPWESNLYILPAGSIPPEPTRILSSESMRQIIEKNRTAFDLVIYDAPPLLGFADTYLLSEHTDGILLVARLGQLKRSLLEKALEDLRISSIPVLGLVVNDSAEKMGTPYTYYRY